MNREPLVTVGTVTAITSAIIALLVSFSVPLSDDQQVAILGVVAVIAPLVVAFVTRPRVTPVKYPTDVDGMPLVRVDSAPRHRA